MKKTILSLMIATFAIASVAQKKTTTSAIIAFDASTAIDPLPKAENKTVIAALDTETGTVQFEVAIKNFAFANPRIQEHFNNSTWMDSDRFPTATFSGAITNLKAVNFKKNGTYTADVEGDLMIHGVTQRVKTTAVITINNGAINTSSEFPVNLSDYNVSGPAIGAGKVSKEPKIIVSAVF
jgi:polyisoprenoid-binding protein YceI